MHFLFKLLGKLADSIIKQTSLYLTTRLECAALGTEQHILEVKFDVVLDARHGGFTVYPRERYCISALSGRVSFVPSVCLTRYESCLTLLLERTGSGNVLHMSECKEAKEASCPFKNKFFVMS